MRPAATSFREYDIRGVVGRDLDAEAAEILARAFGTYLGEARVQGAVVGHDNRASSQAFYFCLHHLRVGGGMMVTASHNPSEFNGFKLACGPGTLYGAEIQRVREIAEHEPPRRPQGRLDAAEVAGAYAAMLADRIRLGPRRLRVALDCGNGTASAFAPEIFRRWGSEVLPLYCESDPAFPHHHPDPVEPRNLVDLIRLVREERADVGIGIDGDGDRIGAVDDRGEILWGDQLMALYWREVLAAHPGTIALIEVKCSQALVDEVRRLGGRPEFTRTGHSLIKARMREVGAVFAGEMSGHMFFADEYYGYDDAVYAAGRLLRMLSHTDRRLSDLAAEIPHYFATPETRVECPDDRKFAVVEALTRDFRERYEVIDVDGARVILPDGWALVRASNTQPVLVVRAEGRTPEALERAKRVITDALRQHPEAAPVSW